jgi:FtsZ-binding cell division protein ZapB
MEYKEVLAKIEEKISRLAEARNDLKQQLDKCKEHNDALFRINNELQQQINELMEKNRELEETRSLQVSVPQVDQKYTRQRISELVNEIDECIAMLKKA